MRACIVESDFELVQLLPVVPYLITRKLIPMTGEKMSVGTLEELLIDELKDLYSAEKQIIRALPKIIKAVSSPELQEGLSNHLEETKGQVSRLEKMGEILTKKMTGKTCVGMKGVLEEGSEVLEDTEKGIVRDAALISACQRVEHYEMAGYGSARDFAKLLGQKEGLHCLRKRWRRRRTLTRR